MSIFLIFDIIHNSKGGTYEEVKFSKNILFHKFYKQVANFPTNDKNFVLSEDCSGCGLCSKVCSVHNIEMINGKPNWQHHCEMCLGCLQYCPKRAIEYGTKSINRERYHNPNVKRVFE